MRIMRRVFEEKEFEALKMMANSLPDDLWKPGCHRQGYDCFEMNHSGLRWAVRKLVSALGPYQHGAALHNPLVSFRLLKINSGRAIPPHVDEAPKGKITRSFNLVVQLPDIGGQLKVDGKEIMLGENDAVIYCASSKEHEITEVHQGKGFILSAQAVSAY